MPNSDRNEYKLPTTYLSVPRGPGAVAILGLIAILPPDPAGFDEQTCGMGASVRCFESRTRHMLASCTCTVRVLYEGIEMQPTPS